MLKLLVKLALTALVANAAWRVGSAYLQFYRFTDAVSQTAQFGGRRSRAELQQKVVEIAVQYDIPLPADGFTVVRDGRNHTIIEGSYIEPVDLAPATNIPGRSTSTSTSSAWKHRARSEVADGNEDLKNEEEFPFLIRASCSWLHWRGDYGPLASIASARLTAVAVTPAIATRLFRDRSPDDVTRTATFNRDASSLTSAWLAAPSSGGAASRTSSESPRTSETSLCARGEYADGD